MKLIIDIPEKTNAHIRSDYGHGVVGFRYDDEGILCHAVYHGTPYEERPHGEWIPCSERLPEKNGVYLVTGENGHVFEYDYSDFTTHNEKWSYCRNEIIAWMPLPEPYKKEGEQE